MLELAALTKRFGARTLLDGVSLRVDPGARIGLVGRNGEGKTTLLKVIAGVESYDEGRVTLQKGVRTGYLRQEIDATATHSILEEASRAQAHLRALEQELRRLEREIADQGASGSDPDAALSERYAKVQREFEVGGGFEADVVLHSTLTGLGLGPDAWDRPLCELSGGWLMRVELAKLLLARPEILLLDEPTNHLDLASIEWFEGVLRDYEGAVIVVSHDRSFLDRQANTIAELEQGRLSSYRGNYTAYESQRERRLEEADARRQTLQRQIEHAARFVERFGAKATKATQAESRKKQIARWEAERDALPQEQKRRSIRLRFPEAPRSGDVVLRLEGIEKSYGTRQIYDALDLEIRRGERIALVGPNGAGKTTLLRIIAGALDFDRGTRELGHNVRLAYFAQHQVEALDEARTVLEEIEADAPLDWVPRLRNLLGSFLFSGEDVTKRVSVLSGGERARLALAKLLLRGANFLVLDEPTNHLDIPAIDVITRALVSFGGTMLVISHDRHFINQITNRVLEVQPATESVRHFAEIHPYSGNYEDFLRERDQRAGAVGGRRGSASQRRAPAAAPPSAGTATRSRDGGAARADAQNGAERFDPRAGSIAATDSSGRGSRKARVSKNALRKLRETSEEIQRSIIDLETERDHIDQLLFHPDVVRDGDRLRSLTEDRSSLEEQLSELYEQWEELEASLEDSSAAPG